jgi:hypothetical protein
MKKITLLLISFIGTIALSNAQATDNCSAVFDDFSNPSLWIHPVLGVNLQNPSAYNTLNISGGLFRFLQSRDNNFNFLYRTSLTISNTDFKAEIDFKHTSNGLSAGGAGHIVLALNDDIQPFFSSIITSPGGLPMSATPMVLTPSIHNGIAVTFESNTDVAPTDFAFKVYLNNAGIITTVGTPISVGGPLASGSTDYYLQLVRVGTTSGILNVYSDFARTVLINSSGLFAIPSAIVNLNTIQFGTNEQQNANRMLTGQLDNLCLKNTIVITSPDLCNVVSDDFSNATIWAHPVLGLPLACNTLATMSITGGQFLFLQSRDNNFNYMNRSGLTISDTDFKAEIDFTHTSNGVSGSGIGGAGHTILALNNGFEPFFSATSSIGSPGSACSTIPLLLTPNAQIGIAVTFESDLPENPTNFFFKVYLNYGVAISSVGVPIPVGPAGVGGTNTNYYIRLERVGTTSGTLSVFSDASHSTLVTGTLPATFIIPATINTLNTVQIGGNEWQEEPRMLTGIVDNLCIQNTEALANNPFQSIDNIFQLFPNPTSNIVNINSNSNIKSIELIDLNGRTIRTSLLNATKTTMNLDKLASGMYYVKVCTENGTGTQKIIKK